MNNFDTNLFLALNGDGGNLLDWLMQLISGRATWIPLYLLIVWLVLRRNGWKYALWMVAFVALGIVLCDQTCNLLKDGVRFLRPTHTAALEGLVHTVDGYRGGLYGTASAHAGNSLVVLLISTAALKKRTYIICMVVWLAAVSYSRIYLGVHFPSQILLGLILGTIYGLSLKAIFKHLATRKGWSETSSSKIS